MITKSFRKTLLTTASAFTIGALAAGGALAATQTDNVDDGSTTALTAGNAGIFSAPAAGTDEIFTVADGVAVGDGGIVIGAANADGVGTLTFSGSSVATGTIGTAGTNDLGVLNFSGASSTVSISGAVNALDTNITETATVTIGGLHTGATLDFTSGKNGSIAFNAGAALSGAVTAGSNGNGTITISGTTNNSSVGGDIGAGGTALGTLNMDSAGKTLALAGDNWINTVNFGADGTITVADNKDVVGNVTATTTGEGTLQFDGTNAQLLTGNVGTSSVSIKRLSQNSTGTLTISGDVYAPLYFDADGTVSIADTKTLSGAVTTETANTGKLTFAGDATMTGDIGVVAGNELNLVTITGAKTVTSSGDIAATTINFANDGVLSVASGKTIEGAVTATTDNNGTITFLGAGTVTGTLGNDGANALKLITINAGAVTVSEDVDTQTLNFAGDGSFAVAATKELEGAVTTTTTNTGTLTFAGAGTMTGDVGATGKVLKLLTVNSTAAGTVATTGDIFATTINFANAASTTGQLDIAATKDVTANITTSTNNQGILNIADGAGTVITGNVGTSSAHLLNIISANTATTTEFVGNIFSKGIDLTGAGTTKVTGDITVGTDNLNFAVDGNLTLVDNSDVTGNITSTTTDEGNINVSGSSVFTGALGTSAAANIGTVNIDSTDSTDVVRFTADSFIETWDATGSNATVRFDTGVQVDVDDAITATTAGSVKYQHYVKEVNDGTDSIGQLVISGVGNSIDATNATFDIQVASDSGFIAAGDTYILVDGETTGTATVPTVTAATDNSYALSFTISQGTDTADLIATAARANTYQSSSSKANESAVGTALEAIGAAGNAGIGSLQGELQSISSAAGVESALETLNPEMSGAINAAATAAAEAGFGVVGNRLDQLAGISGTGVAAGGMSYNHGVWGEVFGTAADQDDRKGVKGYQADTIGFGIGADTALSEETKVGASFAYASTEADSANGDTDIDSYQLSLYGTHDYGKWFTDGLLGFTMNKFDTTRNIVVGAINNQAKGDFDGQQYTIKVGGGYKMDVEGGLNVTPVASLKYNYLALDSYTETGSAQALTVDNEDLHSLKTDIGVKLNYPIVDGSMTYIPEISTSWTYDLIGDEQEAKNNFVGAAATQFTTKGADVAQHQFNVGLGLDVLAQDNVTVSFDYDWASKEDYNSHSGAVKARFAF
ncbi:MAG: hypothetical protein COV35_08810 [Alphaproteobacteria bacterium CG11_big_fil_rev_8_21_14_0_20_39_49]|nr:MAG: hypothetical protein COV35_08810 [Alphaproteobacteria bacterium CG11_big_fil_rev_8_21_14_0_20_39_49]